MSEVGCAKVASANIETAFSGAGRISNKSRKLSPDILSGYAFCHYNYKYDWLRPSLDEIIKAYKTLSAREARSRRARMRALMRALMKTLRRRKVRRRREGKRKRKRGSEG